MPAVPYRANDSDAYYRDYYRKQAGGSLPVFAGKAIMGGKGLGGVFTSALRAATPLLRSAGKTIGKRALDAGVSLANDILSGQNVASSLKRSAKAAGRGLLDDVMGALGSGGGSGPPRKKAKTSSVKKKKKKPSSSSSSSRRRRGGRDILI